MALAVSAAVLAAREVSWGPRGGPRILDRVTLELYAGEVLVLVGPNGAGKSSLLAVLAGDRRPTEGRVELDGEPLGATDPARLARTRAVLRQDHPMPFGFLVREIAELGRAPWHGIPDRPDDREVVARALARTDLAGLVDRRATTLSGGERARLALARALAQDTAVLLLDEPTASLDPRHQHSVMRIARELAGEGRSVLAVLHDLNLAAAYADRIALLHRGRVLACGTPGQALDERLLQAAYEHPLRVLPHPERDGPLVLG